MTAATLNTSAMIQALRTLGLDRSYAWQLANRTRSPSRDLAIRIERELKIPVSHWPTAAEARETQAARRMAPA